MSQSISTDKVSLTLRDKAIDVGARSVLITNFLNSVQAEDLTELPNCEGFGRIRHFKLGKGDKWPRNPLPLMPASKALGISVEDEIRAQVFQNAACNWRCWYCFVDYKLLSANSKYSKFLTCDEMLDLYLAQPNPPKVIDLTGGQPDLTPEWIPWMMEALINKGIQDEVFLWSDDNLSNDYFWRYLTEAQIEMVRTYKMYARVCCFKGIDEQSFSINTRAEPNLFQRQFELTEKLVSLGIDLYFYITLTAPTSIDFDSAVPAMLDRLQSIDNDLPLKVVPLEVLEFTPVIGRSSSYQTDWIDGQYKAIEVWQKELQDRYDSEKRNLPITDIKLRTNES